MRVLVDDLRDVEADVTLRSYPEAISFFRRYLESDEVFFDELLLDHDLGTKEDGYDVLMFLLSNNIRPENVTLVTANPVGVARFRAALLAEGYKASPNGRAFTRVLGV